MFKARAFKIKVYCIFNIPELFPSFLIMFRFSSPSSTLHKHGVIFFTNVFGFFKLNPAVFFFFFYGFRLNLLWYVPLILPEPMSL